MLDVSLKRGYVIFIPVLVVILLTVTASVGYLTTRYRDSEKTENFKNTSAPNDIDQDKNNATKSTSKSVNKTESPTLNNSRSESSPSVASSKIIFGLGPTADSARNSKLNKDTSLGMYTTWYNGPNDLNWMKFWENSLVDQVYLRGKALHLIIWSGDAEGGTPCGRQYPIGSEIDSDMKRLAQIFAGDAQGPSLYVTLFTEFQTFPCIDNQWEGAEKYYTRLQSKMIKIKDIFHKNAPNSKVSIGWGGWQARWDDPVNGGGRTLIDKFKKINKVMDFQSFQAMQTDTNVSDIRGMTKILGKYGRVMVAHHKPDGFHPDTFLGDINAIMKNDFISEMIANGLFAYSIMDEKEINSSNKIYSKVKSAVNTFGR